MAGVKTYLINHKLTVSLATEKSRSPSLLYLIWVMDLSWPWSRMGFCGEESVNIIIWTVLPIWSTRGDICYALY